MKRAITLFTVLLAVAIFVMPTHAAPPGPPDPYEMPVEVVNDSSNPVPITGDVNVITNGIPFQLAFNQDNIDINQYWTTYPVPDDKKLVIEFASASVTVNPDEVPRFSILTSVNGTSAQHYITLVRTGTVIADYFNGGQQMRLYADPGTTVTILINRFTLGCNGSCPIFSVSGSISGYFKEIN